MEKQLLERFFERIFKQYIKRSDAISDIAATLNMTRDSVYRRVRGSTLLTPDEIKILALKFQISLDALIYENHDIVLFQYRSMAKPVKHFDEYLQSLYKDLYRMSKAPNHRLYYASSDLPIFLTFIIPELMSLKMYIWGRMIWDFEYLKDYPFDFDVIPSTTHFLSEKVTKLYMNIPSYDVWNINIFDNTLSQIDYMVNIGAFRNLKDALTVCDKLIELISLMKYMAEKGKKGISKANIDASNIPFELYHNEIAHTNNTVLAVSDEGRVIYTSFDNPNFLKSRDPNFGINSENWFKKLISRSSSISVNTERKRQWFFNYLEMKVKTLKKRINLIVEEQHFPSGF